MKQRRKNRIVVVVCAAVLIAVVLFLFLRNTRQTDSATDNPQSPAGSGQPGMETENPPREIPDLLSGEDSVAPYDVVTADEFSPTTLREEEVRQAVADTLDGLMRLDPAAIEKISIRTTGGDHNPFRYMLQAAVENQAVGAAFKHLASASQYEILRYEVAADAPNHYIFYLACVTPYSADLLSVMAAGSEPKYIQEVSRFGGSGAAAELARIDLKELPLSNDIVALTVVVENDVPMIYHPVSLSYGGRQPQYAFLWGGAAFCGILDGDLLIENTLGYSFEVNEEKFLSVESNALVYDFIESSLAALKKSDFETIAGLKLRDTDMQASSFVSRVIPEISKRFSETPGAFDERLSSLDYSFRFFGFKRSAEDYLPYNTLLITYSIEDPHGGGRTYFSQHISWGTLSDMDREIIAAGVSEMLSLTVGNMT